MKKTIHAVVLDEYNLFADALANLVQSTCNVDMVQNFSCIDKFRKFIKDFGQNELYIFLDYYLPDQNGLSLLIELKRLNSKAKIIFVISKSSNSVLRNILQYRPHGVLSKTDDRQTLIDCFNEVKAGNFYVAPSLATLLLEKTQTDTVAFTPRELELLRYFAQGLTIEETAEKTFLSKHTVVAHRRKMMAKIKGHSIAQLLTYARDNTLI